MHGDFRTSFASTLKVVVPSSVDKYLAKASLDSLKNSFSANLKPEDNPDLLYIAAVGANPNFVNKNSDGMTGETCLKIADKIINKYINVEHTSSKGAFGAISNYSFSTYGDNKLITLDEAKGLKTPFNWNISGFLWRELDEDLSNLIIEASDESSDISAKLSWEIKFADYVIAVGSRDLSEAELITDDTKVEELSQYLKCNGGGGVIPQTKEPVYRILAGDPIPLGFSIVARPAAEVSKIVVLGSEQTKPETIVVQSETESNKQTENKSSETSFLENKSVKDIVDADANNENFIAAANIQSENEKSVKNYIDSNKTLKNIINNNKIQNMKIKKVEDINDEVVKQDGAAKAIASFIGEISQDLNDQLTKYAEKLDAEKKVVEAKVTEVSELKASLDETKKTLAEVQSALAKEQEIRATEKVQNDFNIRMAELHDKFDLDADKAKVIAKDIRGLSDEDYTEKLNSYNVLLAKKAAKTDDEDAEDEKDGGDDEDMENADGTPKDKNAKTKKAKKSSKASVEDELDAAKKKEGQTVVNKTSGEKSLGEQFAEAFAGIKIGEVAK